jgi:hypothetical protein
MWWNEGDGSGGEGGEGGVARGDLRYFRPIGSGREREDGFDG